MPEPSPARAFVAAGPALAAATAAIADAVCQDGAPCQLAVLQNPSPAQLRAAWAALEPGGSLYVEWDAPQLQGTAGVRRQLHAAGFEAAECYWPWPAAAGPLAWLPLEAPAAIRFFLRERPPNAPLGSRLLRQGYSAALAAGQHHRVVQPVCAIARRPGPAPAPRPLESIRAHWADWGLGPPPESLAWLLLTGGARSENKVIALVFAGQEPQPRLAVKMPRVPLAAQALQAEAQQLARTPPRGLPGVPQLVFSGQLAGRWMLAQSALNGPALFASLGRLSLRQLAHKAADWLVRLAGAPASSQPGEWRPLAEGVLQDFELHFGPLAEAAHLSGTRALLQALGPLPLVPEHRDFEPWNVRLAADDQLLVLDWESAQPRGLPALDLIYFVTLLALAQTHALDDDRATRAAYRTLLDPASPAGSVLTECLASYAARVGLDPAALPALRRFTWLLHCCWEYDDLWRDAGHAPAAADLRRSLFFKLWEEDSRPS